MVIVLVIIIIFVSTLFFWSFFTLVALIRTRGVPSVYLTKHQLKGIFENVKLDRNASLIDLGCGDGRVLRMFEKQGVRKLVGYEVNWWGILRGRVINYFIKSKVKIKCKSFFSISLSEFDVVFCYLLPSCLERLELKFKNELKSGAMIISYGFSIPGWEDQEVIYTNKENKKLNRIFVYKI
jgi:hypothetical protein